MGREQKKGRAGNARAYITRAKALKKLQLSLTEFRRLCILKGIYPRDPRKKFEGADKTYYLRKDIDFLAHERLIDTLRAQNAHKKKLVKAKSKKQLDTLKALALTTPRANLDHIIVERYPVFSDALSELDDPLCVVSMFATFPADKKAAISPSRIANCKRLITEFLHYVTLTHALRRAFISIKGYYYQAEIDGEILTWVTPHRFCQALPNDVDYSVMLNFLELYECLLHFVNFRLYTSHNLAYPPRVDHIADAKGNDLDTVITEPHTKKPAHSKRNNHVSSLRPTSVSQIDPAKVAAALAAAQDTIESDDDGAMVTTDQMDTSVTDQIENHAPTPTPGTIENARSDDGDFDDDVTLSKERSKHDLLFSRMSVVVGRETPASELIFVLKAGGASRVVRQDDINTESDIDMQGITHWIVDRPIIASTQRISIDYVQPQYVFDSLNFGVLLPITLYGPGATLPPHLSPFTTDADDGGYKPWYKDVVERIKAGDRTVLADSAVSKYLSRKPVDLNESKTTLSAGERDPAAVSSNTVNPVNASNENIDIEEDNDVIENEDGTVDENAERDLKMMMMSRKKSKKYAQITRVESKNARRKASLTAKRLLVDGLVDEHTTSASKRKKISK